MDTIKCEGCGRDFDACRLILFGIQDGNDLYCCCACLPPTPKSANAWEWIRMQFGMWFTTSEGTRCKYG